MTRRWLSIPEAGNSRGRLTDRVLAARGITGVDAEEFLNPTMRDMHAPELIPDLDKAADRLIEAIASDERIVVYGDYDVDGMTASAILIRMLRHLAPGARVESYIPHRVDEGYGVHAGAMDTLAEDGECVVVTVDCGISGHDAAKRARELGLTLIVTDHHNPPTTLEELPDAFAVVHPRHPDSTYPFGELCGAGVAYKLAWRMATKRAGSDRVDGPTRELLVHLLGFAALGTIADVVPLVNENRAIVRHGLPRIAGSPFEGLRALIVASGLASEKVDTEAVGFRLAPRLNAIGRLGHSAEAVELLTEATGERARVIAESLSALNTERRAVERRILDQAIKMAEAAGMASSDKRAIVLADPGWHPGVIGIVCSRLVERFSRPAILMQQDGRSCKGSGRSVEGVSIHAALEACSEHLERFGGHDMAAGMACEADRFEDFAARFIGYVNEQIGPDELTRTVRPDAKATIRELDVREVENLDRLAPFGASNPRVRVRVRAKVSGDPQVFGARGDHLGLRLADIDRGSPVIRIVGWGWGERASAFYPGAKVEVIIEPKLSRWNGTCRVEPELCDARVLGSDEA